MEYHFLIMIVVSWIYFIGLIRIIVSKAQWNKQKKNILLLSGIVVVGGMLFGKYGANMGLPWWIYYPVPMLMTVLLPPVILKLPRRQVIYYLLGSFSSAPLIHFCFSFFLGWKEYMPFWNIPTLQSLIL